MTFEDCHRVIKRGDVVALRRALDAQELDVNLSNRFSWTLLMLAALEGNSTVAELLLQRGAAVDAINDAGENAFTLAADKGHVPLLRLLLNYGASLEARPHGADLKDWLEIASGLPADKISTILELREHARRERQSGS